MPAISTSAVSAILLAAALSGSSEPAAPPQACWKLYESAADRELRVLDHPDDEAARRYIQQALDCMPPSAPPSDRAHVLERLGRMTEPQAEAVAYYTEALQLRRSVPGGADAGIPETLWYLGSSEIAADRRAEGVAHIEEAARILEDTFGPNHPQTALGLYWLGMTYFNEGQPARGEAYYRRSIAILRKNPVTPGSILSEVIFAFGSQLCRVGRCAEGQALRDESLRLDVGAGLARPPKDAPKPH